MWTSQGISQSLSLSNEKGRVASSSERISETMEVPACDLLQPEIALSHFKIDQKLKIGDVTQQMDGCNEESTERV